VAKAMLTSRTLSDDELLQLPKDGNKYELVDGELVLSPAGGRHEEICALLCAALVAFVRRNKLGKVFGSNLLYILPSGNRRGPDVSFVASRRLPKGRAPKGFFEGAPDLAVEILSPSDRRRKTLDKVGEYLQAGTRLLWLIDPERRTATVYRSLSDVRSIGADGTLDGEDVLVGFRCPLAEILD
jgi:Uma2 family endonuclease